MSPGDQDRPRLKPRRLGAHWWALEPKLALERQLGAKRRVALKGPRRGRWPTAIERRLKTQKEPKGSFCWGAAWVAAPKNSGGGGGI